MRQVIVNGSGDTAKMNIDFQSKLPYLRRTRYLPPKLIFIRTQPSVPLTNLIADVQWQLETWGSNRSLAGEVCRPTSDVLVPESLFFQHSPQVSMCPKKTPMATPSLPPPMLSGAKMTGKWIRVLHVRIDGWSLVGLLLPQAAPSLCFPSLPPPGHPQVRFWSFSNSCASSLKKNLRRARYDGTYL